MQEGTTMERAAQNQFTAPLARRFRSQRSPRVRSRTSYGAVLAGAMTLKVERSQLDMLGVAVSDKR